MIKEETNKIVEERLTESDLKQMHGCPICGIWFKGLFCPECGRQK